MCAHGSRSRRIKMSNELKTGSTMKKFWLLSVITPLLLASSCSEQGKNQEINEESPKELFALKNSGWDIYEGENYRYSDNSLPRICPTRCSLMRTAPWVTPRLFPDFSPVHCRKRPTTRVLLPITAKTSSSLIRF